MPAGTSWATFNRARRTGVTRTTAALDALFRARNPAHVAALRAASPFAGLPEPFPSALAGQGLSELEINHIRDWPDADKDRVRDALATAIDTNLTVRFVWALHDGNRERTIIRRPGPGAMTITFFSPWGRVRPRGPDDVTIDVGQG